MSLRSASRGAKTALLLGTLIHLLFWLSLPTGFLNPLFVEANEGLRQASDFYGIYQAGTNLVHGYSIYDSHDYRNESPGYVPFYYFYRYLPPTALLTAPWTLVLPPRPAYWLWVIFCELLLLLVVRSIGRDGRWPASRRLVTAALWLGFFPFYIEQVMGQFSIVMAVFLWVLWKRENATGEAGGGGALGGQPQAPGTSRHLRALGEIFRRWRTYRWRADAVGSRSLLAAWVASLCLKTYSALLVFPYLRDRRLKRVLVGCGLTALVSLPYFLFRPGDLREFIRLNFSPFTPTFHKGSFGLHNLLRGAVAQLPGSWASLRVEVGSADAGLPSLILLGASGVVFVLALWGTLRLLDHPNRAALDLALWVAAFFLIFKSIWEYHYVMLLPVVTALYLTTGSRLVLAAGLLLGLPTLYALAPALAGQPSTAAATDWPGWFLLLHLSVKSLPTLALFLWCLHQAGTRGGHSAATGSGRTRI